MNFEVILHAPVWLKLTIHSVGTVHRLQSTILLANICTNRYTQVKGFGQTEGSMSTWSFSEHFLLLGSKSGSPEDHLNSNEINPNDT